jgi:hypothetical protein
MYQATLVSLLAAGFVGLASGALALPQTKKAAPVDFSREIRPLLQKRCSACHGGIKRQGGLSFLRLEDALRPAASGRRPVVPGRPDESEILRRVTAIDGRRMPPSGERLTRGEMAALRGWIAAGAPWKRHWSLEPVRRPAVPAVKHAAWARNPIDGFILSRLEAKGIRPSPEADPHTLIRRLSLDLTGLPPTPEEVDQFLRESAADEAQRSTLNAQRFTGAYERLVDRLLARPHFGERWGRHWLDLARYADSDGYEVDRARPNAWHWRDWVIRAVNEDMPFDRFTVEQLAGDLLPEGTPAQKLATAFHRQTLTNNEGGVDKEEYRVKAVMDRVSTTGTVWLGLTLGCAQCHDHPYDAVSQRDYYSLYAFFNNADETDLEMPASPPPAAAAQGARPPSPLKLAVLSERAESRTTHLFHRGDFLQPDRSREIPPAAPAALHRLTARNPARPDRLDLARWLFDPANPLTSRVAVNDVWLRLFGQGLVPTPEDFGAAGEPPTHPELLDWLAAEFAAPTHRSPLTPHEPWSRKALIRLIVTSAAYRQSSRHRPELAQVDPRNRLLHRQNRFRVEAEIVRDLHLAASGLLARKIGGPSVFPPIPADLAKISFRSELPWRASQGEDRYRRGMYTFFKRSLPDPNLAVFDCPDANAALPRRNASNTPTQALATMNNEVYVEAARAMARRLLETPFATDEERLTYAVRLSVARPPRPGELNRLRDLLIESRAWYRERAEDAAKMVENYQPKNVPAPEAAAWVVAAGTILNLDEFITRE